jgi:hypothetical protein
MRAEERQPEDDEVQGEMTDQKYPILLPVDACVGPSVTVSRRRRCRPQSGSAFSTIIIIRRSTIEIERETAVFDDIGSSGFHVARRYCPRCGSPLTTESDAAPNVMFVNAGGIDANEWFHPVMELFVGQRRPWVAQAPGARQLEGNPPI